MNVCKKLCKECPFSNKSMPGWLASYTVMDFQIMQRQDIMFPCHMAMGDNDIDLDFVNEMVEGGEINLCRGYAESMIKSCKMPVNPAFRQVLNEIREEGLSEDSMAIWDFNEHHSKFS